MSSDDESDHDRRHDNPDETADQEAAMAILSALIDRARILQAELEAFRTRLRDLRLERTVELGHFRGTVQAELNMLERLHGQPSGERTSHVARSSNLPFLENLWSTVKQQGGVVALQKRVHTSSGVKLLSQGLRHTRLAGSSRKDGRHRQPSVIVDAITEEGLSWVKLSLVTNTRILFDLAREGWQSDGSDYASGNDNDEDYDSGCEASDDQPKIRRAPVGHFDDEDNDIPLLKTTKELTTAAKNVRVRTRTPKVYVILPRIQPGEVAEVDAVLEACRRTGAILICGKGCQSGPPIEEALPKMVADPLSTFTDTVNIDCTILLALVSEFSHAKVSKEPWFHSALKRQVEIEGNENLLPSLLYPAMSNRRLVTTAAAVTRMREIVETIGTSSEKVRTRIMLGDDPNKTRAELQQEMRDCSAYDVPLDWRLPIEVIEPQWDEMENQLPAEAQAVCAGMTAINQSVFLYGWATGCTTLTSNRTIVKQIEHAMERYIDLDDNVWPKLWLCPTARSLVGKEKRGAKKREEKDVLPLPDPLKREQQRRNGLDVLSLREGHPVTDLRPNGYDYDDVIAAKNAAQRTATDGESVAAQRS